MSVFLPVSPFVSLLGVQVEQLTDDEAVLRLPWRDALATTDDILHGGAISALADITAMTAAWCGSPLPEQLRGVTTSLSVEFLHPAHGQDVIARGRVLHRGTSLNACEIDISTASGTPVAKAIARYKVG